VLIEAGSSWLTTGRNKTGPDLVGFARGKSIGCLQLAFTYLVGRQLIRDGHYTVADLMSIGRNILGRRHVLPSTWFTLRQLQVEGTFPTGTFLVTVHSPISTEKGHMERALYGSCIPVPDDEACDALFPPWNDDVYEDKKAPGYIWCKEQDGDIILNEGRQRKSLQAKNCGDRPIQVHLVLSLSFQFSSSSFFSVFFPLFFPLFPRD
jgi:urease